MFTAEINATFAASHALVFPDGSLEPLHGHNWPVRITVGTENLDGMSCVMDFHELQRQLSKVIAPFSNAHLNDVPPFSSGVNPSAERVAEIIGRAVAENLPEGVSLIEARVGEAPGCFAGWRPALNSG